MRKLRYPLVYLSVLTLLGLSCWAGVERTRRTNDAARAVPESMLKSEPCDSYAPASGFKVCGPFREFVRKTGLTLLGYPISDVLMQTSDDDGKSYAMQYFQWARLEYHSNADPKPRVFLSSVGRYLYKRRYPALDGAPGQVPLNSPDSVYFEPTGKRLGGAFLDYWTKHGGLLVQGYPISDQMEEVVEPGGPKRIVQYFERAIYVYHPDQSPGQQVWALEVGRDYLSLLSYGVAWCNPSASVSGVATPASIELGGTVHLWTWGFSRPEPVWLTIYDPRWAKVLEKKPNELSWLDQVDVDDPSSSPFEFVVPSGGVAGEYVAVISGLFTGRRAEVHFCAH